MLPPFRDYLHENDELRDEILAAVDRVFKCGRLILGPEGAAFEREMAAYIGATSGVGVNSGTDAMILPDSVVRPHGRTVVAPL
jgi:aminotransferase EvaB